MYRVAGRKRFVLVLDTTSSISLNSRWSLIRRQLFRFFLSLPDNVEISIITVGRQAQVVLQPTLLTSDNREGMFGRVPRRILEEGEACLDCAINLADKTLELGGHTGGTILLITATRTRPRLYDDMVQLIKNGQHHLHTITFADSGFYEARDLSQFGSIFVVPENNLDVLSTSLNVSDIFTSIMRHGAGMKIHKFHHQITITDNSSQVVGNFVVEESLRKNLWIEISSAEQDDIEYFELTNPTGQVFQFPNFEQKLVYFKMSGLQEPGIWSYKAKLYSSVARQARVSVEAVGEASSGDLVELETWTSGGETRDSPVLISARLVQNNSPVINASVTASVARPGLEPISITLRDSGTGYPDLTAADGIYSAYFTQFSSEPGFYSVLVTATDNQGRAALPRTSDTERSVRESSETVCCGSTIPFSFTVPTTTFTRQELTGSFFVEEAAPFYLRQGSPHHQDVFPPSRVTDLRKLHYQDDSLFVTLAWTAPGNDLDYGKAFRYEIRCYTNREALREENFTEMGILVHSSLVPVPEDYGVEQRSTVGIPWPNEVFYYAIVAYDEEDNRGEVSNIVSVYSVERSSPHTAVLGFEGENSDEDVYPLHESLPLTSISSDKLIYAVSGVISALLVVMILIVVATLLRSYKQNKQSSDMSTSHTHICVKDFQSSLAEPVKKVASLPDVTKDSFVSKYTIGDNDSGEQDSINKSPIPSDSDNFSWHHLTSTSPNKARGQEVAGVHRIHSSSYHQQASAESSVYSCTSDSSGEFVLGPTPRISVLEDYSVYRDLSHLDSSSQQYFSITQLPRELQGCSLVPYSPHFDDTLESHKRRHVSLV